MQKGLATVSSHRSRATKLMRGVCQTFRCQPFYDMAAWWNWQTQRSAKPTIPSGVIVGSNPTAATIFQILRLFCALFTFYFTLLQASHASIFRVIFHAAAGTILRETVDS